MTSANLLHSENTIYPFFPDCLLTCGNLQAEQAPDYRLYKSEPELTTVKEEGDEANGDDKDKNETSTESKATPPSKVPPYPVGIVAPRTKSPMSPPESSTIASYVTLRKTKKPESRCDRPRSAVDQMGFGERDFIRTRMSVEEQLERMRRNQEASSLREKRRETLSRSSSFNKDNPLLHLQRRAQTEVACLNSVELETALLQLKVAQKEQTEATPGANTVDGPPISPQLCESQRVIIVDLGTDPKRVEIVNFQPFEDDDQDLTSSPANILTENSFQPSTPEPKEQETEESLTPSQEEHLDSCKQLTGDSKTHNINSNMLSVQTFTVVSSDT